MKRRTIALLLGAFPLLLASCGKGEIPLSSYIETLDVFSGKDTAKVLQLTDLHWTYGTDVPRQKAYLDALLTNSSPDLVVCTGDNSMLANTKTISSFVSTMDELAKKHHFRYATTYGNHDRQGFYHRNAWRDAFLKSEYAICKEVDDELSGDSNFAISLTKGEETKWNIVLIDSNSYTQLQASRYDYDVIHDDQIRWYEEVQEEAQNVPNLVYCHIPLHELEFAFRLAGDKGESLEEGKGRPGTGSAPGFLSRYSGVMLEKDSISSEELGVSRSYVGYKRTSMFAKMSEHNGKGVFFGHDHVNDFIAEYSLEETSPKIAIGYGLKTGDGLYFQEGMIGGTLSEIAVDGSVHFTRCYQSYQDSYEGGNGFSQEEVFA